MNMRKQIILSLLVSFMFFGCSISNGKKEKLINAYPNDKDKINKNISDSDAEKMYEISANNNDYSYSDLCYNYVMNNEETPEMVKNIIRKFNSDYNFSDFELFRSEKNSDELRFKTNIINEKTSWEYALGVTYNEDKVKNVTFEADSNNSSENYYMAFYLKSLKLMITADSYFANNVGEASDILSKAENQEIEYNGITYKVKDTATASIFTIQF